MAGRILAVGDVHGYLMQLVQLLRSVNLDEVDTLVFLGDLIDRGPASSEVIDFVLKLRQNYEVITLMGNHEEMLLESARGELPASLWYEWGGRQTIDSYGDSLNDIPLDHITFLQDLQPYWETETEIFVHALLDPNLPAADQSVDSLRWRKFDPMLPPHCSGKRVVCGHTAQRNGLPRTSDGWVCIDTFLYGGQWLSCLDVGADRVYQVNEMGQSRDFPLSDLQ